MLMQVNILVCGFSVTTELEIEDSELEGMDQEERDEYIQQQAYEYVRDGLEVSCEEIE